MAQHPPAALRARRKKRKETPLHRTPRRTALITRRQVAGIRISLHRHSRESGNPLAVVGGSRAMALSVVPLASTRTRYEPSDQENSSSNPASSSTGTSSSLALSSFEPASSPT